MDWLNGSKSRLMLIGIVAATMLGGGIANADFTFCGPTNPGLSLNSPHRDFPVCISADGLEFYLFSDRPGGYGNSDIWVATRATTDQDWGTPVNIGPTVNSSANEQSGSISADGRLLYFCSDRSGNWDIWGTTRATRNSPWETPVNLGTTLNSSAIDWGPWISADSLALYFDSERSGGHGLSDIWVSTRESVFLPWGTPVNLQTSINSSSDEISFCMTASERVLFYCDSLAGRIRPVVNGDADIWMATRMTTLHQWGNPVNAGSIVNSIFNDEVPRISPDGFSLYFSSNRPGGYGDYDIWQSQIIPIVDFDNDGIVDMDDLLILIGNWGRNEPLCDIGPTPLGDGIVDDADLEVLMSYWGRDITCDPTLIACWMLNETEGTIAYDSVDDYHGTWHGEPFGQSGPFDGIDDYVSTPFVLNPAQTEFCISAWVQGGEPGQTIISQTDSSNWLSLDPSEGKLMTNLLPAGDGFPPLPLVSDFIISDGHWHEVALVWDGMGRSLYIDGLIVAQDTHDALAYCEEGLYIGCGMNRRTGSFFFGHIANVCVRNQALTP